MRDLDQIYADLDKAYEMLRDDPRRMNQVKEMVNSAGKQISIAKIKLVACLACGEEPSMPMFGKMSGVPLKPNAKLIGA